MSKSCCLSTEPQLRLLQGKEYSHGKVHNPPQQHPAKAQGQCQFDKLATTQHNQTHSDISQPFASTCASLKASITSSCQAAPASTAQIAVKATFRQASAAGLSKIQNLQGKESTGHKPHHTSPPTGQNPAYSLTGMRKLPAVQHSRKTPELTSYAPKTGCQLREPGPQPPEGPGRKNR